jgi:hypothetical protein
VPASSLTAVAADTSPPALEAPPFTPKNAAGAVAATAGETATSCPSPDPATYHWSKKNLIDEIVVHVNICAEVGNTLPRRRQLPDLRSSRTFAAPSGTDLVPPAPAAFELSGNLPDPCAAAFAASEGWLPPGTAAFALPRALFGLASGSLTTARRF